ncbi:hypothetical protein [Domibacillus iocasae]|uniref:Uncharacterized protein n=1 Tax=Domibacillus iocasae TaxID=1714016 RepID=A0A1E7DNP7_9BACI|nr:hypothetical protein [Domibacillus iocasae]OES44625.1 hypothetical protein BA724_10200 [Domibacillus iocasae]
MQKLNSTYIILSFLAFLLISSILIGYLSYQSAKNEIEKQMLFSAKESTLMLDRLIGDRVNMKINDVQFYADLVTKNDIQSEESAGCASGLISMPNFIGKPISIYIRTLDGIMVQDSRLIMTLVERPWYHEASGRQLLTLCLASPTTTRLPLNQWPPQQKNSSLLLKKANIAAKSLSFMAEELRQVVRKFSV